MWIDEVGLITKTITYNSIGNEEITETNNTVFCEVKSIGMNEFYNAATTGFKPSIVFIVHSYEYAGEENVIYNNQKYKIVRTYSRNSEEIELVCERVLGNG